MSSLTICRKLHLINAICIIIVSFASVCNVDAAAVPSNNDDQQTIFIQVPLNNVHVHYANLTGIPILKHDVEHLYVHPDRADNVQDQINYSLGARVSGDNLVAHTERNQQWPTPQNVKITLTYPASGLGAQVTYVAIQVNQSTNLGKAYVVAGGLHLRMISITVEAYNVHFVNYSAQFYGVQ